MARGAGGGGKVDAEQRAARGAGGGDGGGMDEEQDEETRTARAGSSAAHGTGGDGEGGGDGGDAEGMVGMGERVVRRDDGERIEEWSTRRNGKRRMEAPLVVAPGANAVSRKMPKGGKAVQWTAVARDTYVERQRRFERGEGGGVT